MREGCFTLIQGPLTHKRFAYNPPVKNLVCQRFLYYRLRPKLGSQWFLGRCLSCDTLKKKIKKKNSSIKV